MPRRARGFSLLELMITITVMAILLAIAVPSFRDVIHRNQVSSASNAMLASLNYARSEAITRGQLVSMCPGDATAGCASGSKVYDQGWLVYTYPAGAASANKAYTASSILLRATDPQTNVSIQAGSGTIVTFGQQGQIKPSTPLVFATCYRSGSSGTGTITAKVPGAQLDVNGSGSVTSKVATGCSP
ncbi:GspH/FimT family pseudopilin [Rhodanobacter lindaniclasticus]